MIGTQKEIIKKIGKKKDYFCIQVKGNQKTLKEDIEDYFADKGFRRKWKKAGTEKVLQTNIAGGVEEFVRAVRRHWAIESYHWILNMTFREDTSRTLNKNVARNLNILRKLAILILEELPFRKKFSRRIKRYIISLDVRRYLKLFFDI